MNRMMQSLLLVLLAAPAFAGEPGMPPTTPTTPTTPATPTAGTETPAEALTDAEIAHVVVTMNDLAIEEARMAKRRAANAAVRTFAERMITEHTTMNTKAKELFGRLGIVPADNAASRAMKDEHTTLADTMKDLEGAAFDKAYVDAQVKGHGSFLERIDAKLVPKAQNAELKAMLETARTDVSAHLEQARELQKQLETPIAPASIAD
jgi:putative membrane protein